MMSGFDPWKFPIPGNRPTPVGATCDIIFDALSISRHGHYDRLTNWLMFLCGQIQSPRPDVMPDRREGIARAEGFVTARIETSAS